MPDRILLISYAFPPTSAPEALLSAKRMSGLPGFAVDVVCAEPPEGYTVDDHSLDPYVTEGFASVTRVHRGRAWNYVRLGRYAGIVRPPDEWRPLNGPARRAAARRIGRGEYAAVVTWSQPHSTHLVGSALRRRYGTPWIAHLSDPWMRNPFVSCGTAERWINERLERRVFGGADRLLFTSAETVELCLGAYPRKWRDKARVLPHAYEPRLYPPAPPHGETDGRILLRYVGAFYGPRSPRPLAAGLARLESAVLRRLRIEIVGRVEDGMLETPEVRQLPEGVLTVRPPVDYIASLGMMREADGLLVVDAPADSSPFLPSKLVDYVGAGRPVAALTPEGAAAALVRRLGGPVADPADAAACAQALTDLVARIDSGGPGAFGCPHVRREYEADAVRAQMAAVIRDLSSRASAA